MNLLLATLVRRRMAAQLHDLPPHILRDVGMDPAQPSRIPAKGDKP